MAARMTPRFRDLPDVDWASFADDEVATYDATSDTLTGEVPVTGGPPSGAAGGVLGGSYPNPDFAADMATQAELTAGLAGKADSSTVATDAELATHTADTTFVHGIANTAILATTTDITTHASDATNVHGITDTAELVTDADVDALKPSLGAANTDEALRALGTGAGQAAVGEDFETHQTADANVHGIADTGALLDSTAFTDKGGLLTAFGDNDPAFLEPGADGQVLTSDESEAKGLVWADPAAGDITQADLTAHSADTTSVHGIADTSALATDAEVATAVSDHSVDTTSVHGIADTSALATASSVATAVSNHEADTTSVHGIADTSALATLPIAEANVTGLTAALAGKQPLDSDLTAIAALTTTSFGRGLLEKADAAALLSAAGAQASDSDLTAIAALTTTSYGRSLLEAANAAGARTTLAAAADTVDAAAGTGSLRTLGTSSTSAAAGNDSRLSDARTPSAHATAHADGGSDELVTALDPLTYPAALRLDKYVTGQYYPCSQILHGGLAGSGAPPINRATFTMFVVWATTTFDRIACYITVNGTATAVMRLGIYNDNNGVPGTVNLDAGTVAIDAGAAAIKAITISKQLTPGRYWAVSSGQVATPATCRRTFPGVFGCYMDTAFNGAMFYTDSVTGAFGDNPSISAAAGNPTLVGLRALSSP